MIGTIVIIIGGNKNTSVIRKCMFDVKEKLQEKDKPVII